MHVRIVKVHDAWILPGGRVTGIKEFTIDGLLYIGLIGIYYLTLLHLLPYLITIYYPILVEWLDLQVNYRGHWVSKLVPT